VFGLDLKELKKQQKQIITKVESLCRQYHGTITDFEADSGETKEESGTGEFQLVATRFVLQGELIIEETVFDLSKILNSSGEEDDGTEEHFELEDKSQGSLVWDIDFN
jgi:hypothetical protein